MEIQRACEECALAVERYQKLVEERGKSTIIHYVSVCQKFYFSEYTNNRKDPNFSQETQETAIKRMKAS